MLKTLFLSVKKIFYWTDNFLFKIPIIGKHLYLRQLSKFIIAGGLITLFDFAFYIALTRFFLFWELHYLWANFISMSIGAVGSFAINKLWVFNNRAEKVFSQYFKFWIIAGFGGMLLYQGLMTMFVEYMNLYDILGKALAAFITLFFRFGAQKFWIFK